MVFMNAIRNFLPALFFAFQATLLQAAPMGDADARHLLTRAGFGAAPADVAEWSGLSRQQAIARLLKALPADSTAPPAIDYTPPSRLRAMDDEARKDFQREQRRQGIEARAWWLERMLVAPTPAAQLHERMTLFWHNHFVSSVEKVKSMRLMLDQNQLLRRHALGNFGELLHAVSKDPAMIVYLDSATNRRGSPNENFAREVMELFTLGEGQYGEQDIKEAARAFTGWSIEPETGAFRWRPYAHDDGAKTVLGQRGNFDGDAVLDILLAQPETAVFVTRKLWREFVSPTPDEREVARIAGRFRGSGHDIRVALHEILSSRAFWATENRAALIKSPVDFVVGTLRGLNADVPDSRALALLLRTLGQDLFAPPNVRGWPGGEVWINSGTLLARKQLIERLGRRERIDTTAMLDPAWQLK